MPLHKGKAKDSDTCRRIRQRSSYICHAMRIHFLSNVYSYPKKNNRKWTSVELSAAWSRWSWLMVTVFALQVLCLSLLVWHCLLSILVVCITVALWEHVIAYFLFFLTILQCMFAVAWNLVDFAKDITTWVGEYFIKNSCVEHSLFVNDYIFQGRTFSGNWVQ